MAKPWEKYGSQQGAPGVIPLGSPDPLKPGQQVIQQQQIQQNQQQLNQQPVQQQGNVLNNQRTAQDIQFERSKVAADLANKYNNDQRVTDYRTVLPMVVSAMAADKGKQGDLTVVYAWAKAMDPAGSVREGDTDLAQSSASYFQQARQYLARINEGKGLDPAVRRGLIREMRNKAHTLDLGYMQARTDYGALAKQGGIPEQIVVGQHDGTKYQHVEAQYRNYLDALNKEGELPHAPAMNAKTGDDTRTTNDQQRTAALDAMIRKGVPFEQANKWVRDQGGDPLSGREYAKAVQFAKSNPNYNGSLAEFTVTTRTNPVQQVMDRVVGPGDIGFVKGQKEALDRAALGAQSLYNAAVPQSMETDSASQAQQQTQNFFADKAYDPNGETLGRLVGSGLLTAPIRGPMAAGAAGNLLMTDSTSPFDVATNAVEGAVGGKLADGLIRGVSGAIAPSGRDAMIRLNEQGVRFSPGQMIGPRARNLEDRLTANPVLGPKIDAIRDEGLNAANRIPANRALGAIGETLPADVQAGHQAVAYTKDRLGNFYDNAINGQQIGLDQTYVSRLNALGSRSPLRDSEFNTAGDILGKEVGGAFQEPNTPLGMMSGRTYKKLDSRLGQLGTDFRRSPNVFDRDIGDLLFDVKDQTRALARRQSPQMGNALRQADEGYANFKILERAASSNPSTGIFTPGQLRTAVRSGDRSVGKGATARGEARMQDLASDMSETQPSTIGSSGTTERSDVNKMAPWVIGSLLSPMYSETAEQIIARTLLRHPGPQAETVAKGLRRLPRGMFGGIIPYGINSASGN